MGNQQGSEHSDGKEKEVSQGHNSKMKAAGPLPKTERPYVSLLPIEKLTKRLEEITLTEESSHGISFGIFQRHVFADYPMLAARLFAFFEKLTHHNSNSGPLSAASFLQVTEKLMAVMSDERQTELYLKMYAEPSASEIKKLHFLELSSVSHVVALDHYPDGPRCCRLSKSTLQALADAAFHNKEVVPLSYLVHWVLEHSPRLILGLHRYVVHQLNTSYRDLDLPNTAGNPPENMDLGTPVLDRELSFPGVVEELPLSQVWLLAVSLPKIYTQPSMFHSPSSSGLSSFDSQGLIARWIGSICPSHWVPLYNSGQHGIGANRFMTHVLSYRGPTLTFVRGEGGVEFCVGATQEWKESHQYWGGVDSVLLQTKPIFHVIERGNKLLYLNVSIRGYPQGLRAGLDPRKPGLSINDDFTVVEYRGIPYPLASVEVWGCGTVESRENQLDIKKWQVKQAEKQRQVKLSNADWMDHPDRYLLELGGRTTYNNSNS